MPGGRWDPQTRVAVIGVGVLVVTVGVLTTVRWRSDLGAAALVFGGLLVGLAGVAGGTVFGPREPAEIRIITTDPAALTESEKSPRSAISPAERATLTDGAVLALRSAPAIRVPLADETPLATALIVGDTERAVTILAQRLRAIAPSVVAYHEAVLAIVANVVADQSSEPGAGRGLYPLLGPFPVPGLPIAIDIRAGNRGRPEAMRQTYQALFEAEPGLGAILVVVDTPVHGPMLDLPAGEFPSRLCEVAGRPVVWIGWRVGEPATTITAGISTACQRAIPQAGVPPRFVIPAQRRPEMVGNRQGEFAPAEGPEPLCSKGPATNGGGSGGSSDTAAWQQAADLRWRGQIPEAEQAYRAIAEARAARFGPDDPSTLAARDQHAVVLRDLDRLAEALAECDDVLRTRIRVLGEDHPETLATRSGLAKLYQDLGELDRAITEHEAVLRRRAEVCGPDHQDTLMSRSLLASALHLAGRLPEAAAAHRMVLQSRLRLLGPVHLDTAVSRHRLAGVLYELGQLEEAVVEYRAARDAYQSLLGPSSPFTRAATSDLALAERALR